MKNVSRRNMLQISGLTAVGSMVGGPAFSQVSKKDTTPGKKLKVLVVGGHPGDPECGCGGTMALFAAEGHEVVSAYLNRGGRGIQGKSYDEAAKIRTAEALHACKILHARAEFLTQIDAESEINNARYTEMSDFIKRENPDIVFTQWPIDSHRDHQACSLLVYDAWVRMEKKFDLYYYEVTSGAETQIFSPTILVNISSVIKQKKAACYAHPSTKPEEWYDKIQETIQKFRGIELNCEYAEAYVRHSQNPESIIPKIG